MAMKDYNSINFKNNAIDKMNGKFGKNDDTKPKNPKEKASGPVNLTGVQNALNKGIAGIKKGVSDAKTSLKSQGAKLKDTKIQNPIKVTKNYVGKEIDGKLVVGEEKSRKTLLGSKSEDKSRYPYIDKGSKVVKQKFVSDDNKTVIKKRIKDGEVVREKMRSRKN